MNQLLPIIRRKRRPLLPVESAPVAKAENIQPSSSNYDAPSHPTPNTEHAAKNSQQVVATDEKQNDAEDY